VRNHFLSVYHSEVRELAKCHKGFLKHNTTNNKLKQDRQCTINVTLRRIHVTIFAVEKQYYIFWLRISVALVIQHAMRMRRFILLSVACLILPYFSMLSHKRPIFGKMFLNIRILKFHIIFTVHSVLYNNFYFNQVTREVCINVSIPPSLYLKICPTAFLSETHLRSKFTPSLVLYHKLHADTNIISGIRTCQPSTLAAIIVPTSLSGMVAMCAFSDLNLTTVVSRICRKIEIK
jgi:hypothetical protein